jgi:tetratricopeptide (TPR) repeat protein
LKENGALRAIGPCLPCRIRSLLLSVILACSAASCVAQNASVDSVRQLYNQKNWPEIARVVTRSPHNSAEIDLYLGLALAHLERWPEAQLVLQDGERKDPRDERFHVELAGIAYRAKDYGHAKRELHRSLALYPHDLYALNFLGTIDLLQGNLEATLEYWNRIQSPKVAKIEQIPQPRLKTTLMERSFAIAPLSVLRLNDFELTEAQLETLGVFPIRRWELVPAADDSYNLEFHAIEENGWGANKWAAALSALRGLPYETVYPEYHNAGESAINFDSLIRWDSQKRRLFASVSMPLQQSPKWRFDAYIDGRDENWNLTNSLFGAATPVTALKLRRAEVGAGVRHIETGRWSWSTKASFSRRTFGNFTNIPVSAAPFFLSGNVVEWDAGSDYRLLFLPEQRITVDLTGFGGVARKFAPQGSDVFDRAEGSLRFHWFPQAEGDDYEMTSQWRSGLLNGVAPLDQFYTLGVERDDSDLWLRGISATRGGAKGNSPMGRRYMLWNWDWQKVIYRDAYFEFKAGPLFDAGDISDPSGAFGSHGWLWDPGAGLTVRVLDTVDVIFSYGHDLRSGQNTFFAAGLK